MLRNTRRTKQVDFTVAFINYVNHNLHLNRNIMKKEWSKSLKMTSDIYKEQSDNVRRI